MASGLFGVLVVWMVVLGLLAGLFDLGLDVGFGYCA